MTQVILLLGGNLGSVTETFREVRADLEREVGAIIRCSEELRSEAWGFQASSEFLNQAVMIETQLQAEELLDATQRIEARRGRDREREFVEKGVSGQRYCSRAIDIDIIFYGDLILRSERLTLPHALLREREFVLRPIAQIAPQLRHPESGESVEMMLNNLVIDNE